MLNHVIKFALTNRVAIAMMAVGVSIWGTFVVLRLPVDVLPDLNRPTVTIMTDAHGLVPEDVESLVTRHVERSVYGASGVQRVRSSSGMGLSMVAVEFGWEMDVYRCRQIVQEKLQSVVGLLPGGAVPKMAPITSIMGQVQHIGIRSVDGKVSTTRLRSLADQVIKPRILSVPGVAQVVNNGGAPRQLQVILDTQKMRVAKVSVQDVEAAIRAANVSASGGIYESGSEGLMINVNGQLEGRQDLADSVVRDDPLRPILVRDVAEVVFGPAAARIGEAGVDGGPGVIMVVMKQPEVDTVDLANRVEKELDSIAASLPPGVEVVPGIYRQADFIERAIDNVTDAVRDGVILVVVVLFLFLLNLRTTLITLTVIPLSLAVTAVIFDLMGISINTMTLGGLAVAIGALVDDAIVDVENVFRRLKENAGRQNVLKVVYQASCEVRRPIVVGTLVVTVVYMPLFALSGMEGRLFTPIGVTYILSLAASLVIALTVTPVMCYWLLPNAEAITSNRQPRMVLRLKSIAGRLIDISIKHRQRIVAVLLGLIVVFSVATFFQGSRFLPPFNEGTAQINMALPPGTSLQRSDQFGSDLEKEALAVAGVLHVGRRTGRGEGDEHAEGVNVSELIVTFDPDSGRSRDVMLADIRKRIEARFPGFAIATEQPMAHLISHMLSGVFAQVAIKVQGQDMSVLRRTAREVEAAIHDIPGVKDLMVEQQMLVEQIEVKPRREALGLLGMRAEDVAHTVELALEGTEVSRLNAGVFTYPIVLRLRAVDRQDLEQLRNLPMTSPSGRSVRLADVATIGKSLTSYGVKRENAIRRIAVQLNVEGRSLSEVVADIETVLGPFRDRMPEGYSLVLSGQFEAQQRAAQKILFLSIVSLLAMGALLYWHFHSVNLVWQTLVNIPVALLGGAIAIQVTAQDISIASLVGFISLGGIAARNKILLLDHYLHLMIREGEEFSEAMIRRAGQERIVPVLMTALTSGIALMPLVLTPGQPGRELLYPVATVIVGGLITTTLIDLLLTPGLFWRFGREASQLLVSRSHATSDLPRFDEDTPS